MTSEGDYPFGRAGVYLIDTPAAVAQAILTRLRLREGDWFLDTQEGTAYDTRILGHNTQDTRDPAFQERILGTPGVLEIIEYGSILSEDRKLTVSARVSTQFGAITITGVL